MVYTLDEGHGRHNCDTHQVDTWILQRIGAGYLSQQEAASLSSVYGGNINAWLQGELPPGLGGLDLLQLSYACSGLAPQAPVPLNDLTSKLYNDTAFERAIPLPPGFTVQARYFYEDITNIAPTRLARVTDTEIVTPPGKISIADTRRMADTIRQKTAQQGGTVLVVTFVKRHDRLRVPRTWTPPGPLQSACGLIHVNCGTVRIPFGGDAVQDVDVWRVRVLEDIAPVLVVAAAVVAALLIIGIIEYYRTKDVTSVTKPIGDLVGIIRSGVSDFSPAGAAAGVVTPLLLFVAAGGVLTLGFMLAAKQSGLNVGSYQPPSLPTPSGSLGLNAGPVTVQTGFTGGSSGGSGGGGGGAGRRRRS